MPHIAITMYPGRDDETKRKLASKMQQAMIEALGVDPEVVSVSIQDVPQSDWAAHLAAQTGEMFLPPRK